MKQFTAFLIFLLVIETAAVIYLWNRPGRGIPVLMKPLDRTGRVEEKETAEPAKTSPQALESAFRKTLTDKPEAVASLIPRAPMMGGEWRADESHTDFIAPNFARIYYEDGHVAGTLVVAIDDPKRPATWKTLYDDPNPE